jgi:hypothetical protein
VKTGCFGKTVKQSSGHHAFLDSNTPLAGLFDSKELCRILGGFGSIGIFSPKVV